jgi:hypothetical protein
MLSHLEQQAMTTNTVTEAAASFYAKLSDTERAEFDALAKTLREAIKAKRPDYQISMVSLREAVFAAAAFDHARGRRVYAPGTHLLDMAKGEVRP